MHAFRRRRRAARFGRAFPPDDQQLSDPLHGRAPELGADAREQVVARVAIVTRDAHLDELVRAERDVDLVQYRRRETMMTDGHDGIEVMRLCAKRAAAVGLEWWHEAGRRSR
jgi:hypothetical protein